MPARQTYGAAMRWESEAAEATAQARFLTTPPLMYNRARPRERKNTIEGEV